LNLIMERKRISTQRLEELFKEVIKEAENIGIPIARTLAPLKINTRAKARFGCCRLEKKPFGRSEYHIEISEKTLYSSEKNIKQIIAHELLHTCPDCMNHGERWKVYASAMNKVYGYNITRTSTDEKLGLRPEDSTGIREQSYKYTLICQKCSAKIRRKRMCKVVENPDRYRCGKCGGKLKLE